MRRRVHLAGMLRPIALVAVLGAGVAALTLGGTGRRADIVVGHRYEILTLDPQRMSYQQDFRVAAALYEGLAVLDSESARPVPAAAERWSIAPDGRSLVFSLRKDGRWSTGEPVVADDFVAAWRRAMMPDTAADYSGQFFVIEGAREFFQWRLQALAEFAREGGDAESLAALTRRRFEEMVGLLAPDDLTLVVRLVRPTPYLLDLLCLGSFAPVHAATLERFTTVDAATGRIRTDPAWTRPGTLPGNGPYVLDHWRYKRDLRLRRNPHYWNASAVAAETIDILPMEDGNTAVLAFESGSLDWIADVVVEYRADLLAQRERYLERHRGAFESALAAGLSVDDAVASLPPPRRSAGERRDVRAFDAFGTDFFSFNCRAQLADGRPNPFADPAVRRAFCRSVDKAVLVHDVTRLHERTSGSLTPPGSIDGYVPPAGLAHDPVAAREELAQAGWVDRDGDGRVEDASATPFPTIDLLYTTGSARYEDLALALRDMWQRELGVAIEPRAKEPRFAKDDLQRGNFMIARGGWYGDFGDPLTFLELSRTGDGNNDRGYTSPRYDALLEAADVEADPAKRYAILAEAERFLLEEEPPLVPLCTYRTIYMYHPGELRGLSEHPRLEQYLGRLTRSGGHGGGAED